jgi:hypothetical protein
MNINNSMLLVVEWGVKNPGVGETDLGFDFLFYPKHLFLETDDYYQLPSLLRWAYHHASGQIEGVLYDENEFISFKFTDIPLDCRVRNINLVVFSSGDTAYQFMVLDKGHFYNCRCMKCKLKLPEWQDQSIVGELYTNADFHRIQSELQLSLEELREGMDDEVDDEEEVDDDEVDDDEVDDDDDEVDDDDDMIENNAETTEQIEDYDDNSDVDSMS